MTENKPTTKKKEIRDVKKLPAALGLKPEKKGAKAKAEKPASTKAPALLSPEDTLKEAVTIASTIRGLRHREDGLAGELKEVRAKITTQTDLLNSLLLDGARGQTRLPLTEAKPAEAKKVETAPAVVPSDAPPRVLRVLRAEAEGHVAEIRETGPKVWSLFVQNGTAEFVPVIEGVTREKACAEAAKALAVESIVWRQASAEQPAVVPSTPEPAVA